MTRSLLLTIALALSCLGAGTGAYLAGRSSGPDLNLVAHSAFVAGARSGARAGASTGAGAGYQAGYGAGYRQAYSRAYRAAYLQAAGS